MNGELFQVRVIHFFFFTKKRQFNKLTLGLGRSARLSIILVFLVICFYSEVRAI